MPKIVQENFVASLSLHNANARIRLPNRDYWLAADRGRESIDFVSRHIARFGAMLIVLFCYVHWLLLRANALTPPALSSRWYMAGLVAFLAAVLLWATIFLGRFRTVPRPAL